MPYSQQIQALFERLSDMTFSDASRFKKALITAVKSKNNIDKSTLDQLNEQITQANERYLTRQKAIPANIDFPEALPVTAKKSEIYKAIKHHQVVIIAGETGSGKTTQIPKICLELGLGDKGYIGHTQPRRIAARSVANRIADELGSPIGELVGYKVRFNDQVSENTFIKLMTDGILLAEIQKDRYLLQYSTIIIDEAHERSLNIDFILGYLKQILPKRPDLKVIITSATIDVDRFSSHFDHAPIIEVSGRTYPVDVRYRALSDSNESESFQGIINAIDELSHEDYGDILIFLTGEREIRDVAEQLTKLDLPHTEILPLYARLSISEQNRIFQSHVGRRIVLSTNVAETSLTVPGIKYVIDPGLARMSRYSYRTKVQRLPIEAISQASANQRAGRCGRTSNGICIRLYDENDFLSRPQFTEPEILRTNLASVILQMTALGLGDISAFPFVEQPEQKHIKDGVQLLEELGAIYHKKQHYFLTAIGKLLAQLPIDPRLARMLVESKNNGCVKELMIITSALSIQDPRERPMERQQAADEKHQRFLDKESDFNSFVKLWDYIQEKQRELTSNQFRQLCRKEFFNYLRIREWQDVYTQIRQTLKQLAFPINSIASDYRSIHLSILSGLLSHVGMKEIDKFEYIGSRTIKFAIFPSSGLFKHAPKWCVASELVETTRLWGRVIAKIEPEWIEPIASHLVKKSYSEPRWSKKQGTTIANEKVTLLGLPIVTNRVVNYCQIDPTLSRELFIRHALVEGDWIADYPFIASNRALITVIEDLEHKSRRQDILVDDEVLYQFYEPKIPHSVISSVHFAQWWRTQQKSSPDLLLLTKAVLVNPNAQRVSKDAYPDHWQYNNLKLKLTYQFDLGDQHDGVTVHIPLHLLNQVEPIPFEWQVPGFRKDLIVALIKSLPKPLRRSLVPAPNYADALLDRIQPYQTELLPTLEAEFKKMTGVVINHEDWQLTQIPEFLKMTYCIEDEQGKAVYSSKDLLDIKKQLKLVVQSSLAKITKQTHHQPEKKNITTWSFGQLDRITEKKQHNYTIKAYPTLIDDKTSVSIQLVDSEEEQALTMRLGLRRLILLNIPSPIKYLHDKLPNKAKLGLYFNPFGHVIDIIDDCIACGIDYLIEKEGGLTFEQSQFEARLAFIKANINELVVEIAKQAEKILTLNYNINKKIKGRMDLTMALSLTDIRSQLSGLIYKGFMTKAGYSRLSDIYRYLQALEKRIEKLYQDPNKDRAQLIKIDEVSKNYQALLNNIERYSDKKQEIDNIKWMIEELRVNLFAQQMGTPYPISDKRINQFIRQIAGKA